MLVRLLAGAAAFAAVTLSALPAAAQPVTGVGVPEAKSPGVASPAFRCRDGGRHHDRASGCTAFVGGWVYADGQWARYNNRSWQSDSYNDWWNDRPDRAFPRWVQEQQARGTCDPDRMWWSGSGWHC